MKFKDFPSVMPWGNHQNLWLDAALRLLRKTKKTVVEVALEIGYMNPRHFAELFRRESGLYPSDYRR